MIKLDRCNQHGCTEAPAFRFTWPGKDEAAICQTHSRKLRGLATAMGMHLQLIDLPSPADAGSEAPAPHPHGCSVGDVLVGLFRGTPMYSAVVRESLVNCVVDTQERTWHWSNDDRELVDIACEEAGWHAVRAFIPKENPSTTDSPVTLEEAQREVRSACS